LRFRSATTVICAAVADVEMVSTTVSWQPADGSRRTRARLKALCEVETLMCFLGVRHEVSTVVFRTTINHKRRFGQFWGLQTPPIQWNLECGRSLSLHPRDSPYLSVGFRALCVFGRSSQVDAQPEFAPTDEEEYCSSGNRERTTARQTATHVYQVGTSDDVTNATFYVFASHVTYCLSGVDWYDSAGGRGLIFRAPRSLLL